jgi:FtsZ-interacting cell division protein ZipA
MNDVLSIVGVIALVLLLFGIFYRSRRRLMRPRRRQAPFLEFKSEQLKRDLAQFQARNQTAVAQTRAETQAMFDQAQVSKDDIVNEARQAAALAVNAEMERARAEMAVEQAQTLAELRQEWDSLVARTDDSREAGGTSSDPERPNNK